MLKRYAFSFYEVVSPPRALRSKSSVYDGSSYQKTTLYAHDLDELLKSLPEMRAECDKLELGKHF
jgi:hypothetical protein